MIDFDVITGPGPETPPTALRREPPPKPAQPPSVPPDSPDDRAKAAPTEDAG
jgi:hypothetical protein